VITSRHFDVTERMIEEDGKLIIDRHQEVSRLLDENHELSTTAPSAFGDAKFRLAGRIPLVIAEQWSRECGAAIGTKEFALYIRRKLADGDFAKLRVKGF
jgi:hypothetical protein